MKKLLFFTAKWCGPCKAIKPIVEKEAPEKGCELKYIDVDSDEGLDLTLKKHIRNLPTLIALDEQGSEIGRAVGTTAWTEIQQIL